MAAARRAWASCARSDWASQTSLSRQLFDQGVQCRRPRTRSGRGKPDHQAMMLAVGAWMAIPIKALHAKASPRALTAHRALVGPGELKQHLQTRGHSRDGGGR